MKIVSVNSHLKKCTDYTFDNGFIITIADRDGMNEVILSKTGVTDIKSLFLTNERDDAEIFQRNMPYFKSKMIEFDKEHTDFYEESPYLKNIDRLNREIIYKY